jgi:hypothetical protein
MDWHLMKTGAETFDMLHAYGLGILLSYASGLPIQLKDGATAFVLTCSKKSTPCASVDLLDEVLALPTSEEVLACQNDHQSEVSLRVGNLARSSRFLSERSAVEEPP